MTPSNAQISTFSDTCIYEKSILLGCDTAMQNNQFSNLKTLEDGGIMFLPIHRN
jgi:hypothetical protein